MASGFGTYSGTYRTKQGNKYTYKQSSRLPAHYFNIHAQPPTVIKDAKQKILQDFVFMTNQQFSISSNGQVFKGFSFEELKQLLQLWTTGDAGSELGNALGEGIADKLDKDPWTGAGLTKGLSEGLKIENVDDARTSAAHQVLNEAETLWNNVERLLQSYIQKYYQLGEKALLEKCIEIYKSTGREDNQFLAQYNGVQLSSGTQTTLSNKVAGEFESLQDSLEELFTLIGLKGAGGKKGLTQNPYYLGKAIGGNFKALGGETIGEIVGLTAAKEIKIIEKKTEEQINRLFLASGAKVTVGAHQTGEDTISIGGESKQGKGDWMISMNIGNVTIHIPVSQKMSGFQRKDGFYWDKAHKHQTVQVLNLQSLMAMTFTGGPEWIEQHLAVLSSSIDGDIDITNNSPQLNQAIQLWNEFKEAAKYIGLFRALVGTGSLTSNGNVDFAALLIVNNRIVSVGEILSQLVLENNNKIFRMTPSSIIDFSQMRQKVAGPYYQLKNINEIHKNDGGAEERVKEQTAAIEELYIKTKYGFEINMALLGAT